MRRSHNERGVALVEMAIVAPVLMLLCLGVIEYGLLFGHAQDLNASARAGARTATATGKSGPPNDYQIIQSVRNYHGALSAGAVNQVIIYKATNRDNAIPPECLSLAESMRRGGSYDASAGRGVAGLCNIYSGSDLTQPASMATAMQGTNFRMSDRNPEVDWIGVGVIGEHHWISKLFGSSRQVVDAAVMLLEPGPPALEQVPVDETPPPVVNRTTLPPTPPTTQASPRTTAPPRPRPTVVTAPPRTVPPTSPPQTSPPQTWAPQPTSPPTTAPPTTIRMVF